MKSLPSKVSDLKPNPDNPRTITPEAAAGLGYSMESFGDLSILNYCVRSGQLVCGHQRSSQLPPDAEIVNVRQEADPTGQVARGEIVVDGVTWAIRFVDWDANKELAANIAANSPNLGGSFTPSVIGMLDQLAVDLPELTAGLMLDDLKVDLEDLFADLGTGKPDHDADDPGAGEPPVNPVSKVGEIYALGMHTCCPKCGKMNPLKAGS